MFEKILFFIVNECLMLAKILNTHTVFVYALTNINKWFLGKNIPATDSEKIINLAFFSWLSCSKWVLLKLLSLFQVFITCLLAIAMLCDAKIEINLKKRRGRCLQEKTRKEKTTTVKVPNNSFATEKNPCVAICFMTHSKTEMDTCAAG